MRALVLLALGLVAVTARGAEASAVSPVTLPTGAVFGQVEASGKSLLVSGAAPTGDLCAWVAVEPVSLRLGEVARAPCTRPARAAHRFVPVLLRDPRSFDVRVRIARVRSNGRVSYGRVVMHFDETSDTHLEWTYGPRSLWLFDTATSRGPEVLRISTVTGQLEDRVPMPRIFRPLLAANEDGLWLAMAPNGGFPGRGAAPVYHVAPGARAPDLVARGGRAALWLTARGHSAWLDVVSGTTRQEIWRLDGHTGSARRIGRTDRLHASSAVVQPGTETLWTVSDVPRRGSFSSCAAEHVVTIDGRTGRSTPVAELRLPSGTCLYAGPGSTTFAFGSFYVLDSQSTPNVLYRVQP